MSDVDEVRARWQGFLKKIEERHGAMLDEAEQGCLALLDLAELETNPMVNAWQGVSAQLMGLTTKIQDTWDGKVESAFEEAYESADLDDDADKEFAPAEKLTGELEAAKARREAKIFATAADKLLAVAREELGKSFACTQCSAPLPVQEKVFRACFLPCESCETVNTFEPGTRVRNVEHFCAHHLAKHHAIELELAAEQRWDAVREQPSAPYEELVELGKAVEAHWTAFYDKRAEIAPAYLKDRIKDIDAKMRAFYVDMGREDNWRPEGAAARFNQERIVRHIEQIGASIAAAGEFPKDIYTHFYMFFDEDAIKSWLTEVWDERLAAEVHAFYEEDLGLYRQLMPTPIRHLYEGFAREMNESATIVKRRK